jgi:hypothetical protein
MKFSEDRQTLLKGLQTLEVPEGANLKDVPTPRWLSPLPGKDGKHGPGYYAAKVLDLLDDIQLPVRKVQRRKFRSRHFKRVALKPHHQPWKVEKVVRDGWIDGETAEVIALDEAELVNA